MIRELLPAGLSGIMFAALFGAVMSSLDSMLNSAATIFTIDLYQRYRAPGATPARLVTIGRRATAVLVVIGCLWAPMVAAAGSVFAYIQMFWGFISPGIVAVFVFGLLTKSTPPVAAKGALVLGIPVYGGLLWLLPDVAFLHHMMITFIVLSVFIAVVSRIAPMEPRDLFEEAGAVELTPARFARAMACGIVLVTVGLYVAFY
jgi:SSS family solute:Na+ symporter